MASFGLPRSHTRSGRGNGEILCLILIPDSLKSTAEHERKMAITPRHRLIMLYLGQHVRCIFHYFYQWESLLHCSIGHQLSLQEELRQSSFILAHFMPSHWLPCRLAPPPFLQLPASASLLAEASCRAWLESRYHRQWKKMSYPIEKNHLIRKRGERSPLSEAQGRFITNSLVCDKVKKCLWRAGKFL